MLVESPYQRESGYPERYRDRRFRTGSGPGTHRKELRALRELLAGAGGGWWLDLPAGTGRMSAELPGRVVQADRDPAMLRAAGKGLAQVCCSGMALPFRDGTFSGALCLRLLQHLERPQERRAILAELARVTRGPLIVSFFHRASLQHLRRLLRSLLRRRSRRHAISLPDLRADLAAVGLVITASRPLWRFVSEQWLVAASPVTRRPGCG